MIHHILECLSQVQFFRLGWIAASEQENLLLGYTITLDLLVELGAFINAIQNDDGVRSFLPIVVNSLSCRVKYLTFPKCSIVSHLNLFLRILWLYIQKVDDPVLLQLLIEITKCVDHLNILLLKYLLLYLQLMPFRSTSR